MLVEPFGQGGVKVAGRAKVGNLEGVMQEGEQSRDSPMFDVD